jgi:uncharacterized protein (TIGR02147 family)
MPTLYDSKNYREFIKSELDSKRFGWGSRGLLATYLGVKSSFISLVLAGKQDFNLETGLKIARFLGLDEEERKYFLALIGRDRAGSVELKAHFEAELLLLKRGRSEIQNQVRSGRSEFGELDAHLYYEVWHHTAIHMCLMNPRTQTPESIAQYLRIPRKRVLHSLKVLRRLGFIENKDSRWQVKESLFHLGEWSSALRIHHMNWRRMAMSSLDEPKDEDLHFSGVYSLDQKTIKKIKLAIEQLMGEIEPDIREAKDEMVAAMTFDLFRVGSRDGD